MKIGIDVSQLAYPNTGVSNYLKNLVIKLLESDSENQYVLFASSFRNDPHSFLSFLKSSNKNVTIKVSKLPPTLLDILWNQLHIVPIENFVGDVDVFITSDWTEPPTKKAKKVTIIYDLIILKSPSETDKKIIDVQTRKLKWVKKESQKIICISESTKKDVEDLLGIESKKIEVVYPGVTL